MTLAESVRNEKVRTVACKRVLNLSNLEYSCLDPDLSNTDPDPKQGYGSVSRLGFYLWAASLEKTAPSKFFFKYCTCVVCLAQILAAVSKTELEFLNNLWGLGTE